MKAVHINLGYTKGMSGGDECILQTVRYLTNRKMANVMICTECARNTYESLGLQEGDFLKYVTVPDFWNGQGILSLLWAYIRRMFRALRMLQKWPVQETDALVCCSGFFPNSIPFFLLSRKHPRTKLFYWMHMLEPKFWLGFEGAYTGQCSFPDLKRIRYILDMRLYGHLIRPGGVIVAYNPVYKDCLAKRFPRNHVYIIRRFSGVNLPDSVQNEPVSRVFDLAWLGRFHEQKGVFELLDVVHRLKSECPAIRVLVMGGGDQHIETRFEQEVSRHGLSANVEWRGVVTGDAKYRLLRQARVFLMTSTFESFGIVNIEAMKCGLPVVAYDLPVFGVFEKGMIKVPILDNACMAETALNLLRNETYYQRQRQEALQYAMKFSWEKTGAEIYRLLTEHPSATL